jgi:pilus assembly protein CpaF
MTPHTRSPDPRDTGQARGVRTARGVAGGGSAPLTGSSRTGPVAGLTPGLVARVQRRLAATGASATDAAGLRAAVEETLVEDGVVLPAASLSAIVRSIGDELTGLGPLAPLLADPTVTDVLVNGPADVWVERGGTIERAPVRFASAAAVAALVQRVVAPLGLRVDESRPWVDARLPGGERFHAVLPPLAPDGPVVTIRTFARRRLELRDLIEHGALDMATARLLEAMVAAGIAIAVSGATGTGKTTLLNVPERQLSATYYQAVSLLLTAKLLQDRGKVTAKAGRAGVVGAEGGLADFQGPLVFDAGAG